jgi:hypothetical protein
VIVLIVLPVLDSTPTAPWAQVLARIRWGFAKAEIDYNIYSAVVLTTDG